MGKIEEGETSEVERVVSLGNFLYGGKTVKLWNCVLGRPLPAKMLHFRGQASQFGRVRISSPARFSDLQDDFWRKLRRRRRKEEGERRKENAKISLS